ncbi:hypothetical protein C5B95_07245 [Rathayibacter sp. AY1A7]|nr:hypothetical protein C5B95_07245 [Rathayibacter sp. AY1A7]
MWLVPPDVDDTLRTVRIPPQERDWFTSAADALGAKATATSSIADADRPTSDFLFVRMIYHPLW